MLGVYLRKFSIKLCPRLSFFSKLNISPNFLTLFSLFPAIIAAVLITKKNYLLSSIMIVLSLLFDVLDGVCARATSKTSVFGNYLDAIVDRYREIIFYFGFALGGYPLEAFFAVSGSLLISFAKARTAMCVTIDDHDWPAIGDMADRNIIFIIGLILASIKSLFLWQRNIISITLLTIGLLTHIGSFLRFFYARKLIQTEKDKNNPSITHHVKETSGRKKLKSSRL